MELRIHIYLLRPSGRRALVFKSKQGMSTRTTLYENTLLVVLLCYLTCFTISHQRMGTKQKVLIIKLKHS